MNKIISALCFSVLMMPTLAQARLSEVPKWAYDAAHKLIASGVVTDKNITVDELAAFLASENNGGNTADVNLNGIALSHAGIGNHKPHGLAGTSVAGIPSDASVPKKVNTAPASAPIPPLLKRFIEPAPDWVYEPLKELNKAGLISPDNVSLLSAHNLNRREAAILTARAYNLNKQNNVIIDVPTGIYGEDYYTNKNSAAIDNIIQPLLKEFGVEVSALGHGSGKNAFVPKADAKIDKSVKVHGDIRYNVISNSSSSEKYNWNDQRLRARIYLDKPFDENWTANGMIEMYKGLGSGSSNGSYYTQSKDRSLKLDRYYISGKTRLFNMPFNIEAGSTSAFLAEGNVLDAGFKGLKLSTYGPQVNNRSTLYSLGYGKVNDKQKMFYAEARHTTHKSIDYIAGFYRWDNYGTMTDIYSLGADYYIGNYRLGAMYLKAGEKDGSGASDAYVLTAKYGYNRSWVAGTYEIEMHYYDMAGRTYIDHTMSGLGGYMNGFKGYSAGWYYTLMPDVLLGIEYYSLKDKTTAESIKTWWGQVSYGF